MAAPASAPASATALTPAQLVQRYGQGCEHVDDDMWGWFRIQDPNTGLFSPPAPLAGRCNAMRPVCDTCLTHKSAPFLAMHFSWQPCNPCQTHLNNFGALPPVPAGQKHLFTSFWVNDVTCASCTAEIAQTLKKAKHNAKNRRDYQRHKESRIAKQTERNNKAKTALRASAQSSTAQETQHRAAAQRGLGQNPKIEVSKPGTSKSTGIQTGSNPKLPNRASLASTSSTASPVSVGTSSHRAGTPSSASSLSAGPTKSRIPFPKDQTGAGRVYLARSQPVTFLPGDNSKLKETPSQRGRLTSRIPKPPSNPKPPTKSPGPSKAPKLSASTTPAAAKQGKEARKPQALPILPDKKK
jgi:hypothetical protein